MERKFLLIESFISDNNFIVEKEQEDFISYELLVKAEKLNTPTKDIIKDALKEISELDNIYLTINIFEGEEDCPVLKDKTEGDIESFLNHYKIYIDDEEDEEYTLKLSVSKKVHKNKITIYNKESLFKYLKNLKLKETMSVYSKQLKNDVFFMEFLEEVDPVNSSSIYMSKENYFNLDENQIEQIRESRKNNIDIRRKLCNFIGGYSLDYKDFKFNNISDQDINDIFNKLECIMCLIYIGNRSEFINDDKVRISITGQTTTKFELDYKNLVVGESLNQSFKICNWIYEKDGDSVDKIEIARNIISISLDDNPDLSDIRNDLWYSVRSAHEIYLKENVEKYLEVKQEVSKNLFEIMNSIGQIANQIGDGFKTNFIAIITFFISTIISNSTADNRLNNIFTSEITVIALLFLIGSGVYLSLNCYSCKKEIERFQQIYNRSKENYEGILNPEDIKNIYNDDKYLKEDKVYIKKKIRAITICWIIFLVVILVAIYLLGDFKILIEFWEHIKS